MILIILGWTGAVLFAFCGLPQAIKTFRTKRAKDFSWMFLLMWFFGEILTFAYIFGSNYTQKVAFQLPLLCNYVFNGCIVAYLMYAKFRYDRSDSKIRTDLPL